MMHTLCKTLLLIAAIGCASAAVSSYDRQAKAFIDLSSERYFKLYDQIANETYSANNEEDFEALFSKLTNVKRIAEELVGISREASGFNLTRVRSAELRAALQELRTVGDLFVLGEEYFSSVQMNLASLQKMSTDKDIDPYLNGAKMPNEDDSPLAYYPDIQKIVQRSSDVDELKYYWETWRDKNQIWASVNFYTIVQSYQKAAQILEIPVHQLWYRYDSQEMLQQMEHAMVELKPAYKQLHAFVRDELHKKYGGDVVNPNGPIPDHLFQQVVEQAWEAGSIIESYFPRKDLPQYDDFVKQLSAKALINESESFYTSLGFDALSADFHKNQLKDPNEERPDDDCRPALFDLTPHVYMMYCEKVSFRKLMQYHSHMARVYYAEQKKRLPSYYFKAYNLEYPVGEAVVLSASSPTHLTNRGLAKGVQFTENSLQNRLFRMAIHNVLNIPLYYVHTKVMHDLLNGTVDMDTVNKHYWKLLEQHAGIEPPTDRTEGAIDFPYKFYVNIEQNFQTKKFISEILGYQLYRALCQKSNHHGQLHNCDFYGNFVVGNSLKSMMSLGSTKPWKQVLAKVLPKNSGLSSLALLEYYQPIVDWLKTHNAQTKVKIGWNATTKKIV
ncbi:angiotensin-converting enzyme [Drosophila sulfurigaster albostrigata]|uniref:angiotensin-converting enzyme n=1 Tax=Drosophila sulfurigaster albostrigata TaxID=89887 RepID=UPI002D21B0E9|nr:angiotensin-converting enzyme [Drosophila sulfurigaster albostrigata]